MEQSRQRLADCSSKLGTRLHPVEYFYCLLFRASIWYLYSVPGAHEAGGFEIRGHMLDRNMGQVQRTSGQPI